MFRSAVFLLTQPAITRVRNNRIETFYGPTLLDVPAPVFLTDLQPVFFFHYGSLSGGRSSYGRTLFLHGVVTWCLVGKNWVRGDESPNGSDMANLENDAKWKPCFLCTPAPGPAPFPNLTCLACGSLPDRFSRPTRVPLASPSQRQKNSPPRRSR